MGSIRAWGCGGLVVVATVSCGGPSNPVAPATVVSASPAPAATPTPIPSTTPAPASTPTPCPGECRATSTLPAARLTIQLYKVTDSNDKLVRGYTVDSEIPVGFKVTIDTVAKDVHNKETFGQGEIEFLVNDPNLVFVGGNHEFQRKLTVLRPGRLEVTATLDGVTSNVLTLQFKS